MQGLHYLSSAALLVTPCFSARMQVFLVLAVLGHSGPCTEQLGYHCFTKAMRKPALLLSFLWSSGYILVEEPH